ncbi:hypothetical protein DFH06DRAFT_1397430 [Mycena polygramma]|nr:hypothetical protein DFH06DRAFT_1397430 [Mycena polygramma]
MSEFRTDFEVHNPEICPNFWDEFPWDRHRSYLNLNMEHVLRNFSNFKEHDQTRKFSLSATITPFTQLSVQMEEQPEFPVKAVSAAWRCLQNDEIIVHILTYQATRTTPKAECQALLWIALVCKALEGPAMDELWWELTTLTPLVQLLPSVELIGKTYVLNGPLDSAEWSRFDRYARRVRHLYIDPTFGYAAEAVDVHPSVYLRIAQEHIGPLLPRLQTLLCMPLIPEAAIFVPPSLRYVAFETADNEMALAFLSTVSSKARSLDRLRLTLHGAFEPSIYASIAKFCTQHSFPEYVKLDTTLAKFGLKHLFIVGPNQWERDIGNHILYPGFSELEALSIEGGFQFINAAIASVQSAELSDLHISLNDDLFRPTLQWGPLVSSSFTRWSSKLCKVSLDLKYSSEPACFRALFESLDHLRGLREFTIWHYWPIIITDADIQKLAQSCPDLELISLVSGKFEEDVAPSISCLPYLADRCRNLKVIHISLKSTIALPFEIPAGIVPGTILCMLQILNMPLSWEPPKIRALAKFIDIIFPWVTLVEVFEFFSEKIAPFSAKKEVKFSKPFHTIFQLKPMWKIGNKKPRLQPETLLLFRNPFVKNILRWVSPARHPAERLQPNNSPDFSPHWDLVHTTTVRPSLSPFDNTMQRWQRY